MASLPVEYVCESVLQRQIKGDCVDMQPAAKQRDDIVVSFLLILKKARQHHVGPSLRSVVDSAETDVCKVLGYRSVSQSMLRTITSRVFVC